MRVHSSNIEPQCLFPLCVRGLWKISVVKFRRKICELVSCFHIRFSNLREILNSVEFSSPKFTELSSKFEVHSSIIIYCSYEMKRIRCITFAYSFSRVYRSFVSFIYCRNILFVRVYCARCTHSKCIHLLLIYLTFTRLYRALYIALFT